MANDAQVTMKATVLPDEIATTFAGSMTIAPADANDKWYYKLTQVSNTSTNLIAGYFTDYDAVAVGSSPASLGTSDLVKFLFIKNTSANDIYIVLDGGTVTTATGDAIKIPAGDSWYGNLPNTTVGNINAITSTGTADCVVAALVDDV